MIKFYENAPFVAIEYGYEVDSILYKGKSKYQEIMVFENPHFGRMLILDGVVQITERDEFFYHEMLTQVLMHAHPSPKRVVVIGGGDGGTVREVLKHKDVEKVYFVEIDEEVINVSRKFFPTVSSSVDDPRVEIKVMDGAEFVKKASGIDLVLIDSTDPIGFARTLYSREFFASISRALKDDGMFALQSESLLLHPGIVADVQQTIKDVFPIADIYTVPIATYPGNWWAFSAGSKKLDLREMRREFAVETKYYSDEIHQHAFLPRKLYDRLMKGKLNW
ncbi:MAG: polyamine aminopropyltransferase [Thermodesulfovibrionales bacterium]